MLKSACLSIALFVLLVAEEGAEEGEGSEEEEEEEEAEGRSSSFTTVCSLSATIPGSERRFSLVLWA